jgi:hypothetical protein
MTAATETVHLALAGVRDQFDAALCPGSKRTAVPAGMFSRKPRACSRSKRSAGLVS